MNYDTYCDQLHDESEVEADQRTDYLRMVNLQRNAEARPPALLMFDTFEYEAATVPYARADDFFDEEVTKPIEYQTIEQVGAEWCGALRNAL